MPNAYGAPEIGVRKIRDMLKNGHDFILIDVREPKELRFARLNDHRVVVVPLSVLAQKLAGGLPEPARDKKANIVVMCHHGVRSAQVTAWLMNQGWESVVSLQGGIDAYARDIDPTVGFY